MAAKATKSKQPSRRACTVCLHPNRVAIDLAIATGTETLRNLAIQNDPLSFGAISRHSTKCVTAKATREQARIAKLGAAAIQQVEVVKAGSLRQMVRGGLERAQTHEEQLGRLWDGAYSQLVDESGNLKRLVDEDGYVRTDLVERLLDVSKVLTTARGGGTAKWAELAARVEGEIQSGTQVNVLVDARTGELHPQVKAEWDKATVGLMGAIERAALAALTPEQASRFHAALQVELAATSTKEEP